MELRPVNFPVEDGQLLTQREILRHERCSGRDQAPDEPKESGDESHKCEANHRKKDEPDDRAEWLMISLTASMSTRDGVFGRDTGVPAITSSPRNSSLITASPKSVMRGRPRSSIITLAGFRSRCSTPSS